MACMEHECFDCGCGWFDNCYANSCPECGSLQVTNIFDEEDEYISFRE